MELFWALAYLLAALVVHAISTRLPRGNPIVKFVLVGGAGGLALSGHLLFLGGTALGTLAALLTYAFACELYLFLFTLVAGSVSVRLLLLLRERDLSPAEIQSLYDPNGMVDRRIDRLVMAGLLEQSGPCYRVSAKGRRLVGVFLALKGFFRHGQEPPQGRAGTAGQVRGPAHRAIR